MMIGDNHPRDLMSVLQTQGVFRFVPGPVLEESLRKQDESRAAAAAPLPDTAATGLAGHIRTQFEIFSNHRNSARGWSERLLAALRAFNGQYDANKLREIQNFGGSEIYARIIASKCRGASSLLRDVYLAPARPWGLEPPDDPDVPEHIAASITSLVYSELASVDMHGGDASINTDVIRDRVMALME